MCIVLYTSYIDITKKYDAHLKARETLHRNILNAKITSFVDELQKERGMSGGYVQSQGTYFKVSRLQQIDLTNLSYKNLIEYYKKFPHHQSDELYKNLMLFFIELEKVRMQVEMYQLDYNELVSFYSMNINLLLDQIYNSAKMTENNEVANMIYSYSNFLFAKEKNGIKRVLITKIIMNKSISKKEIVNLNNLLLLGRVNINYFKKFLNDEGLLNQYYDLTQQQVKFKVQKIEKKLLKGDLAINMNPKVWFDLMSQNIKNQHDFAEILSDKLILLSSQYEKKITNEMMDLFYINIIILLLFFIFVIIFYSDISHRFDNIVSSMSFISKHDISKYINIKIKSNDELDQIATKFNEMVSELKVRENNNKQITLDLVKSKQEIEKSNRLKSEFLANMSHEIRTPLNAIVGFIDILKDDEIDAKKMRYLDVIKNSSKNLLELINDILDFSKIENSKIVLEYRDFDLIEELNSIVNLFAIKVKEKNINFIVNIDTNLPKIIETDNLKLRQVIINILGNAIKFTTENKTIIFDVKCKSNELYFSIKDEGIGIEENKQRLIFDPFIQADNSTTRKYGGTGLGLAISSRFVEALGGKIELKSEYGKGSVFYFNIPFVIPIKTTQKILSYVEKKILSGKVLLVEDNKSNQLFMNIILKKLGLEFEIANDGLEAVTKFKENRYDIILMDENMPNMTGTEATKIIREIERVKNLKRTSIIALTANALVGDKQKFLDAGMDEYITKPIDKKILHKVLETLLRA